MAPIRFRLLVVCGAAALSACSFPADALWPPLARDEAKKPAAQAEESPAAGAARGDEPAASGNRRPLVVIRFDRPDVSYQQALYTAVDYALRRRPQAGFDLVTVAPAHGSPAQVGESSDRAKRNAEGVLRSLAEMGLPLERVRLSSIASREAQVNEVHLYVR